MEHLELLMDLGADYHVEGDLEAAFACYRTALDMDPLNPILLSNISRLLKEAGCPDAAHRVNVKAQMVRN